MKVTVFLAAAALLLQHATHAAAASTSVPVLQTSAASTDSVQPPVPLPQLALNRDGDAYGLAQELAREKHVQGRIIWIDAGANVGNLNSVAKIDDVISKIKAAGFNMVVLDVKPIVGDTIYPSDYAPRLTEWKGEKVQENLDVLKEFLTAAHTEGLSVYANISTFGEGHKLVHRGLAYTHPMWQTVLYEVYRSVSRRDVEYTIDSINSLPVRPNTLTAVTKQSLLNKDVPGTTIAIVNFDARVEQIIDGSQVSRLHPVIPLQGCALIGNGTGADWIKQNAPLNEILTYHTSPHYVPVTEAPEQLYTVFCDPANPDVRQHEWDIVREIVTKYPVDGVVFDDRLRYAGLNADFSMENRTDFETLIGKKLTWPDDVFQFSPYPGMAPIQGPYFRQWLTWRAGFITSWLTEAARIVRQTRPGAQVAVYAGSWYGDYYQYGSNWAAADLESPFSDLSPEYQATGYAGTLDWLTTGCYYWPATLAEAEATNQPLGATVEAGGIVSNRVVNDDAWTYGGVYALSYQNHPAQFQRAMLAVAATTQGVMVFDLSQIIDYNWWPQITQVFNQITPSVSAGDMTATGTPLSPSAIPALLDQLRAEHRDQAASGNKPERLPPYSGIDGTGF